MRFIKNTTNFQKEFIFLIVLMTPLTMSAQRYTGTVIDPNDNLPIPFVNVYIKGTIIGTTTDFDGKFLLKYKSKTVKKDSISFSYIGYGTKTVSLKKFKNRNKIYLKKEAEAIDEVVVRLSNLSYEDYLMRKIISNKRSNNPSRIKRLEYTETSLLSVFLANLNKETAANGILKSSKSALIKETDSTVMMPVLLSKEVIKHRIDKDENIDKVRTVSIEQEGTLDQLTSVVKTTINQKITQNVNFYDEHLDLLGRSFKSPITSDYKTYYKIYLSDSTEIDGVKHFKFEYYPKNEKSVSFDGSFWVESKTFALTQIDATLPVDANINFIKKLTFDVSYEKVGDKKWFVKSQKSRTRFSLASQKDKKAQYFTVQKNQKYSNFKLEYNDDDPIVAQRDRVAVKNSFSATIETESSALDSLELKTIRGIRILKKNGYIKFFDRFGAMTLNGYYNLNKFDLGPYFDFYVKNGIEGNRYTIPLRTSEKMFKNFLLSGYLGYGTKDKEVKYGAGVKFLLPSEKRTIISGNFYDDYTSIARSRYVQFVQENPYARGAGNIFTVFANDSRLNYSLLKTVHADVSISHEATENARYLFNPFYDGFQANQFNQFVHDGTEIKSFRNIGLLFDLRYSKARNFDQQFFSRLYYGSTIPVYHFTAELGHNKITDGSSNYGAFYARLNASIKQKFLIGSTFLKLFMDGGYILGDVPFPILNNPSGNQNIGLARFNYNLLNTTSYTSDVFTNLHLSFNGGGFLFNKIPLLDRLNIRESVSFKAFYGKLLNNHNTFFEVPKNLVQLQNEPYMELGIGITNLFKLLRIEYVQRLNRGEAFDKVSVRGAIRFRMEVTF